MLVSVIVPMYNSQKYISRCIESIITQTYRDIEIIVIDDGSNDKSFEIVEKFSKKDNRIKLITQKNSGVSTSRNNGLKLASGKYIFFIDSDDWIEKNYIEILVNTSEKENLEFTFCDWYVYEKEKIYVDNINKEFFNKTTCEDVFKHFLNSRSGGAPWAKVFLKSIIEEYDIKFIEGLPYGEDYLFVLKYISNITRLKYINKALVNYNCIELGAHAKVRKNYDEVQFLIEKKKKDIVYNSKYFKKKYDLLISKQYISIACLSIINIKNLNLSLKEINKLIIEIINRFNFINEFKKNELNINDFTNREKIIIRLILNRRYKILSLILKAFNISGR